MGESHPSPTDTWTETVQAGPARPLLRERIPSRWRQPAAVVGAFVAGAVVAAVAAMGWQGEDPVPAAITVDEHDVELVLVAARTPSAPPAGRRPSAMLTFDVDASLLLSGNSTSEVHSIGSLDGSFEVEAPDLPATISPSRRLRPVALSLTVPDCQRVTPWAPGDRPLSVAWHDQDGLVHGDRAGDLDRSVARAWSRFLDRACPDPAID